MVAPWVTPTLRSGEGAANLARDDGRGHLHGLAALGCRGGLAGDDGGGHLHGLPAPLHHRGGHLHALPRAVLHRGGRTTVTGVRGKPESPLRTLLQVRMLNRQMRSNNAARATIEGQAGVGEGEPQPLCSSHCFVHKSSLTHISKEVICQSVEGLPCPGKVERLAPHLSLRNIVGLHKHASATSEKNEL